jgi:hypothetical protein
MKLPVWLRWILVLPGAIIGGILATFPLHWILQLKSAFNGTLFGFIELPPNAFTTIEYYLYPFVIALAYVLGGEAIAPKHKFKTVIVLAVLYILFTLGTLFFINNSGLQASFGLRSVGPVLGLLLGIYIARKNTKADPTTLVERAKVN